MQLFNTRLWFSATLLLFTVALSAQAQMLVPSPALSNAQAPANRTLKTGMEDIPHAESVKWRPLPDNGPEKVEQEIIIGRTLYDLQSNASNCRRISMTPDGRIAATWTQGFQSAASAYPDRGTGYNSRVNFAWSDAPTTRLEAVRTGWPNHVFTASGKEFIVTHTSDNILNTLRRDHSTAAWTNGTIPTATPSGLLWPRAAIGGDNGETIHVIAITVPAALSGEPYLGVDGHILYYRSQDGGVTWDRTDIAIDGLGSAFTIGSDADSYYIDARGNNVAFGVFNGWDDVLLFKSADNGDTWTKHVINDFPLERYVTNAGYNYEDLPPFMDERPDSLAIFTSDSYGTVLIDHDGMAHAFFGQMWVADTDLGDQGTSFYPGTDGLAYWNETFGDDSLRTIISTIDQNGNGELDIVVDGTGVRVGAYFASLTSMPSAGIDAAGNIYLTYAGIIEGETSADDDMQHYRHVYVTSSTDGGLTWAAPYDIINADIFSEPDLVDFVEGVFPTMVREVDDQVRLIYMQDFRPGLSVRGDEDAASDNFIAYVQIPVADLGVVGTDERVAPATYQLQLLPTVTSGTTQARFELPTAAAVTMVLVNMHGQPVQTLAQQWMPAGPQQRDIDLSHLPSAVYYLVLKIDNTFTAMEIIKQ